MLRIFLPASLIIALAIASAGFVAAQQLSPPILFAADNSASYDETGLAQGSLFVVFGENIGPPVLTQVSSFPIPPQLGGTAITVTSGATTLSCPMIYSEAGQAAAILPSNTPLGKASLTLTFNGVQTPFPLMIEVLPTSVGIYSINSSGLGQGVFTAVDYSLKTFTATAKPGDLITAWATGVGPISGPDNVLPQTFPNFPGVEVFVGNQSANVIYAGRSGCCSAVDQISFEMPQGVTGCYVPVSVRSGGKLSNFVTIAADAQGAACSDAAPTIPTGIVSRALQGQSIRTAVAAIGPTSILRGLGFSQAHYLAEQLSQWLHVNVPQQDAAVLIRAAQNHNRRAIDRMMRKYAKALKKLDATSKATIQRAVNLSQEGSIADFGQYNSAAVLASAVGGLFPSAGSCTVLTSEYGSLGSSATGLDAGSSLSLTGPAASWTLAPTSSGEYQALFGSTPSGPNVPPGTYVLAGTGGSDIAAFSATLSITGNITWTNKSSISTVNRSDPLTITWSGGASSQYVLLGGYSTPPNQPPAAFVCVEQATGGSFTIPSYILSALSPTATSGVIFIGPHPLSHQVTIPGVDLAYFADGSNDSRSVVYQ